MTEGRVRKKLARIASHPMQAWSQRVAEEFPDDAALRMQALLWLHAEQQGDDETGPPSLGRAADERYELAVRLDTGATSSVWQAYDRRLGRNVAIKVFHERDESEALDQVLAEARAASDVISDHVVRVLDVQVGDGHPYIVMELVSEYDPEHGEIVRGKTAADTVPTDIDEVARWVMHVARGVHDAHLRNVFHRDLKPKNVLLTPNSRRARVADFGLAVSAASPDAVHPAITLLRRGPLGPVSVRGTPEYMAPEQARGLSPGLDAHNAQDRAVLVAVDIWGIGAIAYELLSGHPPWVVRPADDLSAWEIAASAEHPPRLVRTRTGQSIPHRLRRVLEKAMAPEPARRYLTAAAVANELEAFLDRRPTTQDRSRLLRLALWCRRSPQLALTALVAVALTALAVGTHATVTRLRSERDGLTAAVDAQKAEQARLNSSVEESREALADTRTKLGRERENLSNLEQVLADERSSYQTLLDAKEQALSNATKSTLEILARLEEAQRVQRSADHARLQIERAMLELRREGEKAAKDRDRIRKEREAARAERDMAQRERDEAESQREAALRERDVARRELNDLKRQLERMARARPRN